MSDFTRIKRRVLIRIPGAPDPLITVAIRDAAIKFSKLTRLWRENIIVPSITGDNDDISLNADVDIFEIDKATFNTNKIHPKSIVDLDDMDDNWEAREAGTPSYLTQYQPNTVRLVPISDIAADLSLRVFMVPSDTATTLPDWMVQKYYVTLADGAIADLAAIPNQEFTDPSMANYHGAMFNSEVDRLKTKMMRGQQRSRLKSKSQYF